MAPNIYRPLPAEILDIRNETAIDSTYRLRWTGTAPQPGQFFQVSVLRIGEAPISASGCGDGWIELTIRNVGRVTNAIFDREIGDSIHLRGPYGTPFPLDEYAGRHTIVAAGGTGLAPVRGLIRYLLATRGTETGPSAVSILAGFKTPEDMLFTADLDTWAEQVPVSRTVDRADSGWSGHVGVITTLIPDLDIPDLDAARVIVVGPPLMMKYTVAAFLDREITPEQIWVSHERRMSCGLGKCGHCKIMDSYVCVDGPVYRYSEAQQLMD